MLKRLYLIILPTITLILEILPYGAVCNFMDDEQEVIRNTYSYFSLVPFGYANFAPLITALMTCIIIISLLIYVFTGKYSIFKMVRTILFITIVISFGPLLFGIKYFSLVGMFISITLISELILANFIYSGQINH